MNIIQPLKKGKLATCDNINGTWGDCVKWKKSQRERRILYDLTDMWNLFKENTTKPTEKIRFVVTSGGRQRLGEEELEEGGRKVQILVVR